MIVKARQSSLWSGVVDLGRRGLCRFFEGHGYARNP